MNNFALKAIPQESDVYLTLNELVDEVRIAIFSGLPGVGKSLYINAFQALAENKGKKISVIQWDLARKAFETPAISEYFPMGEGIVHNGLKLAAGKWLMDEVSLWIEEHEDDDEILLIEAPLVGNRFIELVKIQTDAILESYLSHEGVQVIMPIPSKEVRTKIEAERKRQVNDDAKVWTGAKPSVMLMLWKMTCGIANEFGKSIDMSGQPDYDPEVYEFVFSEILKHRYFLPLFVDEVFTIPEMDESQLHNSESIVADEESANYYAEMIKNNYTEAEMNGITEMWYNT